MTSNAKRRILIVDDYKAAADMLAMVVKILGYEVRTAMDGQSGVDTASTFSPDIIIMDIGMPRMNGYEAATHIRQQDWGQNMVLIALTGWDSPEDRQKIQNAGFNHHLVKPAEPQHLKTLLAQIESRWKSAQA
jgi:CheY-like chemotaxis protein